MTSTDDTAGVLLPLRRPPVRESTLVRSDVAHTFDVFVRTIRAWWPLQPMPFGRERARDVTFEPRAGGRVYETWDDGTTVEWGELLVWEPPARFVMSWRSTPEPTEVELNFAAVGPTLTRVSVEHRGWEALTDEQLREDCAVPAATPRGPTREAGRTSSSRSRPPSTPSDPQPTTTRRGRELLRLQAHPTTAHLRRRGHDRVRGDHPGRPCHLLDQAASRRRRHRLRTSHRPGRQLGSRRHRGRHRNRRLRPARRRPAITSGLATVEIYPMPVAAARQRPPRT